MKQDMECEAREHLNLAHYNFNHMAVIDEEAQDNGAQSQGRSRGAGTRGNDMKSAGDSRVIKNMHNTTSGFYPGRFGDRVPTRGNV